MLRLQGPPLADHLDEAGPAVAQLRDVSKVYGTGETEVKALNGLDLDVLRGDYLAVMGASGSGKSTAMNVLGCLDRPTSGSYRLNGTAVEQLDDDALADLRNQELGFVFQQFQYSLKFQILVLSHLDFEIFGLQNMSIVEFSVNF